MLSSECFFHAKRDAENDNAVAALDPTVSVVLFTGVETGFLVGGFNLSEKYELVSWDDDIPNIWKVIKAIFQTTNQLFPKQATL